MKIKEIIYQRKMLNKGIMFIILLWSKEYVYIIMILHIDIIT